MSQFSRNLKILYSRLKKNHFVMYGIPMITFVVGGSFGLKQFRTLRYEVIDQRKQVDPEVLENLNSSREKKTESLEEAYEKYLQADIDNWYNIRGPRPWENSREFQEMQRRNIEKDMQVKVS